MALPTLQVTPGSGATINTLPNAPALTADSISVALATDTVLPLPTGAAADGTDATGVVQLTGGVGIRGWLSGIFSKVSTAANQATQITSLSAILAAIQATDTAIAITNRSGYINGAVSAAAVQSIGTQGWAPGDTLTMPSGAGVGAPAVLNVQSTELAAVPTIAAAGSGGTNGAVTLTGTTGTGTKFILAGTISGGVLTAIGSISFAGNYTVNPTNLAAEPVTGGGLTGATVNIKMAILALGVTTPGVYTAPVTNPLAPAATSGSGVGATVNLTSFTPLSTQVAAANTARQYLAIRNESTAQNIGFSLSGAAALGAVGTSTLLSNFNGYDWSGNRVPSNALTAIGQVAFQQFTAWEG